MFNQSIRSKLLILIVSIILILGSLTAFGIFFLTEKNLLDLKESNLISINKLLSQKIEKELNSSQQYAKLIAIRTRVVDFILEPTKFKQDELQEIFDGYLINDTKYLAIYLIDKKGVALISTDRSFLGISQEGRKPITSFFSVLIAFI